MLGLRLTVCTQGDKDLVKPMLEKRGTIHFGRVLMKPGKPLTFATISLAGSGGDTEATPARNLLVFGLPGAGSVWCLSRLSRVCGVSFARHHRLSRLSSLFRVSFASLVSPLLSLTWGCSWSGGKTHGCERRLGWRHSTWMASTRRSAFRKTC